MATAIRIEVFLFPCTAGRLLVGGVPPEQRPPWRMLIDCGPPDTWPVRQARLKQLAPDDRHIDVALVAHTDSDHIGGMIPSPQSEFGGYVVDCWFNGHAHLPDGSPTRSVVQGESVVAGLTGPVQLADPALEPGVRRRSNRRGEDR